MANANSPVTMPTGVPIAAPVYLVINDGSVVTTTNGIPVNVVAGTISAENPSVGVLAAAIPADATLLGASDGTNLQQLLVESASQRNLRIGIYNGANEITANSTTYTAKFGLDANILGTLGTAFSTAGKVDVKGADGDVFVRQAAAANLNATVTIQAVTGTSLVADQTNSELRVSNYGKSSAAGDTALLLDSTGRTLVGASTTTVYTLASAATTSSSNSGDLDVSKLREISIDINTTAKTGTTPTIQFFYARKGADGIYYTLWQSAVITNVAANTISTAIGAGMAYNQSLGPTGQLSWVIGGSATPGYTFSAQIYGK